ncbi:hypothetical protein HanIR_Chr05g0210131 [Helianthus annuus]|nr:hypothetical protein HanIR_Chr05g0210131 [Helianthus annuus]
MKDEEYALARAWLNVSEDTKVANFQTGPEFWNKIRELFLMRWEKINIVTKIPSLANGPISTTNFTNSKKFINETKITGRAEEVTSKF